MTHKNKWLLFSPLGLLGVGAGACLVNWAGHLKQQKVATATWVGAGTAALIVLNGGLSVFGRGVAESVLYQLKEKQDQSS